MKDFESGSSCCKTRAFVKKVTSFVILPSTECGLSYKNTACPKTISTALLGHLQQSLLNPFKGSLHLYYWECGEVAEKGKALKVLDVTEAEESKTQARVASWPRPGSRDPEMNPLQPAVRRKLYRCTRVSSLRSELYTYRCWMCMKIFIDAFKIDHTTREL